MQPVEFTDISSKILQIRIQYTKFANLGFLDE